MVINQNSEKGIKLSKKYKVSIFNVEVPIDGEHWLIYNSLTQAFSMLKGEEILQLNAFKHPEEDSAVSGKLDQFVLNGFLVPEDVDETELFQKQYQQERMRPSHMGITILPTMDCNFACAYCFEGTDKKHAYMSEDVENAVMKSIQGKASTLKSLNITWFGGEPLLGLASIKRLSNRIIPFCDRNQISYYASIITNGYMLSEDVVAELYLRKVRTIQITLDGDQETHDRIRCVKGGDKKGSYDRILDNIVNYTKKFRISTIIRINIDKDNISSIYTLLDDLAERGLDNQPLVSVYFAPIEASTEACACVAGNAFDMEKFAKIEFELFKYAVNRGLTKVSLPYHQVGICNAVRVNGTVILPDGTLHRCWETVAQPDKQIGYLGNGDCITKNNLEEKWMEFSPLNNLECKECSILPACAGYCAYRFLYASEYTGRKTPCPALKYNIKDKLLYFASVQDEDIDKLLFEKENRGL